MNVARTTITLILCAICVVRGDQTVRVIHVVGDVPKPGPVSFEADGLTIDSVMAKVGMDLSSFNTKDQGYNDGNRCPIRVSIFHGGKETTYDPSVDAVAMRAHSLTLNDVISVTDFRNHPQKIVLRKQRIERMLDLGSTEIGDEVLALATLQHEYEEWRADASATPKELDEYLRAVASRLIKDGKGQKIIDLLELKVSSLKLDGLGPTHPVIKSTTSLVQTFQDVSGK